MSYMALMGIWVGDITPQPLSERRRYSFSRDIKEDDLLGGSWRVSEESVSLNSMEAPG